MPQHRPRTSSWCHCMLKYGSDIAQSTQLCVVDRLKCLNHVKQSYRVWKDRTKENFPVPLRVFHLKKLLYILIANIHFLTYNPFTASLCTLSAYLADLPPSSVITLVVVYKGSNAITVGFVVDGFVYCNQWHLWRARPAPAAGLYLSTFHYIVLKQLTQS